MIKHKEKVSLVAISILTIGFSGCFSFGSGGTPQTTPTDETSKLYDTSEFQIVVPKDWDTINQNEFTAEVPDETQVVFRNNVKNETWTANVTVVKKNLQQPMESLEFAKMVINRQSSGLTDYSETRKDESKIKVGEDEDATLFTAFTARKSAEDKVVRYMQTYGVRGDKGYIILGSFSPQESEATVQQVEKIVKSFVLK